MPVSGPSGSSQATLVRSKPTGVGRRHVVITVLRTRAVSWLASMMASLALVLGLQVATTQQAEAVQIYKGRTYYDLVFSRAETYAMGYQGAARTYVKRVPQPYGTILGGYLWLISNKSKTYYRQGRCLVITFARYGWYVNPLPTFTSYRC